MQYHRNLPKSRFMQHAYNRTFLLTVAIRVLLMAANIINILDAGYGKGYAVNIFLVLNIKYHR